MHLHQRIYFLKIAHRNTWLPVLNKTDSMYGGKNKTFVQIVDKLYKHSCYNVISILKKAFFVP